MIALALLFALIIGLLCLLVWLFQRYLNMYGSFNTFQRNRLAGLKSRVEIQKNSMAITETEEQINAVIDKRILELAQKFPVAEIQDEPAGQESETLIMNFKRLFRSTLNLFRVEHHYDV